MTTRNEKFINELIQKASQKKLNNRLPTGYKKRKLSTAQKKANKLEREFNKKRKKFFIKKQLLNNSCGSVLKINK